MSAWLLNLTIGELAGRHPSLAEFMAQSGDPGPANRRMADWLAGLTEEQMVHLAMDREQILAHLDALADRVASLRAASGVTIRDLTILAGRDKDGRAEAFDIPLAAGDVVCIVGPTGSGKSRLLADIECLAQGDTPSGRRVLVNGAAPQSGWRFASDRKLIAQLSQNMNFVVDLSVAEFIAMHADCRMVEDRDQMVEDVIACANDLAGERFKPEVSLTQLSGGQTRALMIADTALLSASPVVLIDEIENAGIDRRKALDLLVAKEKIVLVSTHDPILALMGSRRLVIRNGGVVDVIATSAPEQANRCVLERLDRSLMDIRHRLRNGQRIDGLLEF